MMTQEEAMNMSNEQAVQILIPMRNMMCDQDGCPISDAVFALDKAIEVLSADKIVRCKECKWFDTDNTGETYCMLAKGLCDVNANDHCSYGDRREQ